MILTCPNCGSLQAAKDQVPLQTYKCKRCGALIRIEVKLETRPPIPPS